MLTLRYFHILRSQVMLLVSYRLHDTMRVHDFLPFVFPGLSSASYPGFPCGTSSITKPGGVNL